MVPELREPTYDNTLKEMRLPTLQDRKERGDLITLYKIVSGIEKFNKQDLVIMEEGTREMRGHLKTIKKRQC